MVFFDCALYLSTGFCTFFKKFAKNLRVHFLFLSPKKRNTLLSFAPLEKGLFRLNSLSRY